MADITARLLWYRLGESSQNLAYIWDGIQFVVNAGGAVLNWIFICWVLFGFLTMLFVAFHQYRADRYNNITKKVVTITQPCSKCESSSSSSSPKIAEAAPTALLPPPVTVSSTPTHMENSSWLGDLLCWTTNNCAWKGAVVNELLNSLTEESKNNGVHYAPSSTHTCLIQSTECW